mmetsp:Transcript_16745/g.32577  ORF Transcript_16745/g.32577 Transcript_16745/m.32577 type:complete len:224 (-) Transcript_16745:1969-2640(-)
MAKNTQCCFSNWVVINGSNLVNDFHCRVNILSVTSCLHVKCFYTFIKSHNACSSSCTKNCTGRIDRITRKLFPGSLCNLKRFIGCEVTYYKCFQRSTAQVSPCVIPYKLNIINFLECSELLVNVPSRCVQKNGAIVQRMLVRLLLLKVSVVLDKFFLKTDKLFLRKRRLVRQCLHDSVKKYRKLVSKPTDGNNKPINVIADLVKQSCNLCIIGELYEILLNKV